MATATLVRMPNHPNRGGNRFNRAGANPTPAQVSTARTEAGLTQEAFGELVYKNWRTVQDWESGERRMPPDTWELIQAKLKALELVRRGKLARATLKDLGLFIPDALLEQS
jgi:DNA-binding transcriptional regulator YiaG